MKFISLHIILISSFLSLNWVYLCDVQDILEPSHQLSCLYSKHHNLLPKSASPSKLYPKKETPVEVFVMTDLSTSLLRYLYSKTADTQHAYERGLYLQHLSKSVHSQNYIFELVDLYNAFEHRLSKLNNDILLPKPNDNLNWLLNENYSDNLTRNKTKTFIETKVAAMKLQGFNL